MTKKILLGLLIILTFKSFSQNSKFSVELNLPINMGENMFGKDFKGIVDIGAKYRISNLDLINVSASINAGLSNGTPVEDSRIKNQESKYYLIQPRINGELKIKSLKNVYPMFGIGYTFMIFESSATIDNITTENNINRSGINANFGVSYDLTKKLFAIVQYDFVKLKAGNNISNTNFTTNMNIIKIGIGLKL